MQKRLQDKLKDLPKEPGVYFHKDKDDQIIYIGKAAKLNNRVRQYFQKSRARDSKTESLVAEISDTDWMVVGSELEALFLEAEMIRRYMPKYNVLLRDDKSLSYIRINYDDDYPTVSMTRRPLDDGAKYFGPYFSSYSVKQALKILRKIFPYATRKMPSQKRATLHYHIGLDPGLEEGRTSLKDYRANLRRLIKVIEGQKTDVIKQLEKEMKALSKNQEFEQAAKVRNQIAWLNNLGKQVVFSDREFMDISKDQALTELAGLFNLYDDNSQDTHVDEMQGESENRSKSYVGYEARESQDSTTQFATTSSGASGDAVRQRRRLRNLRRIEGFDISHQQGTDVVASMVVFTNGVSNKAEYRKFKTKINKNDDFYNMNETITRRLSDKNIKAWGLPDLFLIDGGKGQLGAALGAIHPLQGYSLLQGVSLQRVVVIGLAKREEQIVIHKKLSNVSLNLDFLNKLGGFVTESGDYLLVSLPHSTHIVKLLQRIRDESHRFAVSYHSSLKTKRMKASILDDIDGIGPATKKKLIRTFGGALNVKNASADELKNAIGEAKAKILIKALDIEPISKKR